MCKCENKTVIVVDDDKIFLEIIKNELQVMNVGKVLTFENAESAMKELKKVKADLIILDYHLNDVVEKNLSGHQALNKFQTVSPNSSIMFISGSCQETLLEEYLNCRKIDYCLKDHLDFKRLRTKINNLLKAA